MVVIWIRDWFSAAVVTSLGFMMTYLLCEMTVSIYRISRPLDMGYVALAMLAGGWLFASMLGYHVRRLYQRTVPDQAEARRLVSIMRTARSPRARTGSRTTMNSGPTHRSMSSGTR